MDRFNALGRGTQIMLVSGALLFISLFLPWQDFDIGDLGQFSGWRGFAGVVLGLLTIVLLAWCIVRIASVDIPLPVSTAMTAALLGVLILFFAIIKLLTILGDEPTIWAYIGVVLAILVAAGAFQTVQEAGGVDTLKSEIPSMPASSGTQSSPPPVSSAPPPSTTPEAAPPPVETTPPAEPPRRPKPHPSRMRPRGPRRPARRLARRSCRFARRGGPRRANREKGPTSGDFRVPSGTNDLGRRRLLRRGTAERARRGEDQGPLDRRKAPARRVRPALLQPVPHLAEPGDRLRPRGHGDTDARRVGRLGPPDRVRADRPRLARPGRQGVGPGAAGDGSLGARHRSSSRWCSSG